jgi:hypothetical protein
LGGDVPFRQARLTLKVEEVGALDDRQNGRQGEPGRLVDEAVEVGQGDLREPALVEALDGPFLD